MNRIVLVFRMLPYECPRFLWELSTFLPDPNDELITLHFPLHLGCQEALSQVTYISRYQIGMISPIVPKFLEMGDYLCHTGLAKQFFTSQRVIFATCWAKEKLLVTPKFPEPSCFLNLRWALLRTKVALRWLSCLFSVSYANMINNYAEGNNIKPLLSPEGHAYVLRIACIFWVYSKISEDFIHAR